MGASGFGSLKGMLEFESCAVDAEQQLSSQLRGRRKSHSGELSTTDAYSDMDILPPRFLSEMSMPAAYHRPRADESDVNEMSVRPNAYRRSGRFADLAHV